LHACTDKKPENGAASEFDQETIRSASSAPAAKGVPIPADPWADLNIPSYLRRDRLGPPALGPADDDLGDLQ
jgi:hypothetical protein